LENQLHDGSWGGEIYYPKDRIICTLNAVTALARYGSRGAEAINRAEIFLQKHLEQVVNGMPDLVGFELLFPALLSDALSCGIKIQDETYGYTKVKKDKLKRIPADLLYSPKISLTHSLEFLRDDIDIERMHLSCSENGSLGNSPAATAFYALQCHKKNETYESRTLDYLISACQQPALMVLWPFRMFELLWSLLTISFSGIAVTDFVGDEIWNEIKTSMSSNGVGLDSTFGAPDGDCTSVAVRLLHDAGIFQDTRVLEKYQAADASAFVTYPVGFKNLIRQKTGQKRWQTDHC